LILLVAQLTVFRVQLKLIVSFKEYLKIFSETVTHIQVSGYFLT